MPNPSENRQWYPWRQHWWVSTAIFWLGSATAFAGGFANDWWVYGSAILVGAVSTATTETLYDRNKRRISITQTEDE